MRAPLRLLFPLLALLLAFGAAPNGAEAQGDTRTFKVHNFEWTLPSDEWEFHEVSGDEQSAGYVIRAQSSSGQVQAVAYVSPTGGLSLAERLQELQQGMVGVLQRDSMELLGQKMVPTTLSGVKGNVIVMAGKNDDASAHMRWYGIEFRGKFYHLLLRTYHGAHRSEREAINELKQGFRLLKGAKGQDEDEAFDELAGVEGDAGGGGDDAGAGDEPTADGGAWPDKGPQRDGRKLIFTGYNLEWTMPDGSPFKWERPINDLSKAFTENENGGITMSPVIAFTARAKREKKEFEKDTPDFNFANGRLFLGRLQGAANTAEQFRNARFQQQVGDLNGLSDLQASGTRIKDEVKIGNFQGGYLQLQGTHRAGDATLHMFQVVLRGWLYRWDVVMIGHDDRDRMLAPLLGALLDGVEFPENTDFVRGPILGPDGIPEFSGQRGEDADKEKEIQGPGYEFEKPEGFAQLPFNTNMNKAIRMAVETRSKDGQAYLYFDVHAWRTANLRKERRSPEQLLEQRILEWEGGAGDDIDTGRPKNGSFGRAKGLKYELKSTKNGVPYVEEGYFVDHKQITYWFRLQYGGEDAEKKMRREAKDVKRGLKFKK